MMELTIRDWMVIIGVLLILAVLLDAWRRVRRENYSRVNVKLAQPNPDSSERDAELSWLKELPNGGARSVRRDDLLRAQGRAAASDAAASVKQSDKRVASAPEPSGEVAPAELTDSDSENLAAHNADVQGSTPESSESGIDTPLVEGFGSREPEEPRNLDWLEGMGEEQDDNSVGRFAPGIDPEVFMLNVVARDPSGFRGEDILHILLACDLRFGDMNFFHRHEFGAGKGAVQFSVANMVQPGVFDIDNMADFTTPGLVFFLTLPGPKEMMKAFDYMLETAQAVSRNLGGDVLDESRSVLTKQTLEHSRQQIRDLERRMLAQSR